MAPPKKTPVSLRRGDSGIAVWALQRALNALPADHLTEDSVFGHETAKIVRLYQSTRNLNPDEVCGPQTQARLARSLIAVADPDDTAPEGLLRSIVEGESGNYIAAVNWGVPGGCDCGYTQRRVYEPYEHETVKRAFDSAYQLKLLRTQLIERKQTFRSKPAVSSDERAWRLAVLAHNYPAGADRLSRTKESDLSSYWVTPQQWVVSIRAHFEDGTPVQTPLEWCRFYSLGDSRHQHNGKMLRYVKEFS